MSEVKLPVLDKVKYGSGAAGIVTAIVTVVAQYIPFFAGEEARTAVEVLINGGVFGALAAIAAFIGGFVTKEEAVDLDVSVDTSE